MGRTLTLYQGADMSPDWDYSDWADWPSGEFRIRAMNGEGAQSQIMLRDERGESGSPADLPGALTFHSVAAHSTVTLTEDASGSAKHLWRGWVIPKDYTRGVQKADRARQVSVSLADLHAADMHGIIVGRDAPESRPAETDVARVNWLLGAYLNGSPRASTIIGDAYVASGNTVMMEAKDYEDVDPSAVLGDCILASGKRWFIALEDNGTRNLFYDLDEAAVWQSTLQIRQTGNPAEVDGVTTFEPIWDVGPASREDGQQLLSGVKVKGPPGISAYASHPGTVSDYNWYEEVINDSLIETQAEAEQKAAVILPQRRLEQRTYSCSILVPNARVHLVKAGMRITIQAKAIPDADDQVVTPRIAEITYRVHNSTHYKVSLQLDKPKRGAFGTGSPVGPKPAPTDPDGGDGTPQPGETLSGLEHWTWNGPAAEPIENPAPGAFTNAFNIDAPGTNIKCEAPNNGFGPVAASACWILAPVSVNSGEVVASAGSAYVFSVTHTHYSPTYRIYAQWIDAGGNVLGETVIAPTATWGDGWHTNTVQGTAPANTTKVRIATDSGSPTFAGTAVFFDSITISGVSAGSTDPADVYAIAPPYAGESPYYARSDQKWPAASVILGDSAEIGFTDTDGNGYVSGEEAFRQLRDLVESGTTTSTVVDHGSMGSTEEFDAVAHDHEGVQDDNLTVTLTGATAGEAAWMTLVLTQDGTGGNTLTLPASVVNASDVESAWNDTADAVNILSLFSYDGGTTWYGFLAGGSGSSEPTESSPRWLLVTHNDGSGPDLVWEGDDLVEEWSELV